MKSYRVHRVLTYFMEMRGFSDLLPFTAHNDLLILRLEEPTVEFYRFLYKYVGQDVTWVNRLLIEDQELHDIIRHPDLEIYVLYYKASPAGYAEIDRAVPGEVELTYYGLMPQYRRKGLGTYLLRGILEKVSSYNPNRFWLRTCELDHEAALPTFEKVGFRIYEKNMIDQVVLE